MDRFTDMQVFVQVVDSGSISAAAERLNLAKSAVSRRLSELEARLGAQLLNRTTRRLHLTDTGQAYYQRCVAILADLAEAENAVSQAHGALRGRIKVAMPHAFGLRHLAPLILEFLERHPELALELDFNDRQIDLMHEGFDLAIRIANLPDSSLIARRLAPIRSLLCASPDYLARHGTPATARELTRHLLLGYSNLANPDQLNYHTPDGQPGSVRVPLRLLANNGDFLVHAAIAGQGLTLSPTFYLCDALRAGQLVPVLADHAWPEFSAYAVYPPTRHLSRRVRVFIDFLVERLAGEPSWDRRD